MLKKLIYALIFPVIWACMLIIHIAFFSTEPDLSNRLVWLFDRVVILSCFLLYPVHHFVPEQYKNILPFGIQFFFWWLFSIFIRSLYGRLQRLGSKRS